ncbi:hypothetical protein BPUTSESOX_2040 [uncultured Gammaproteobacteria bacterium]|jgi:hypothetical protein|uniref:hypothetical protein n=1 Tax=thiotrophic endosymbiont of Bathymodiolus puteoserpentis (Logatchev) TaxID=343240 RepID=UPI0010B31BF5|nr:hypothetical protein [thiotrophic endosymbiont of Bathymodiolus puteoserpentis (Logatchev)]CAC9503253.1 hypothetical protein [uncultured Gammaproteobacteria bacterium]CAC9575943.1 hypothetical protein [uncultured Gammaproteobacteria bacterium]CAC9652031.1 hypothetical protein [uncultured Gammaproteobacteria bacterium]CAC9952062.1 hypothetical protein [uncultured Gammaproteobacteria bacterium]SSC10009.1 hypothetical protein BPUTEOSOX_864 [thiotrophic endosymbiont of Bathymodiolus puteoserpen
MIKFIVGSIVILALIGGAVQFKSTDKDYSLIVNKETAKVSVYSGVIKIYDFVKGLVGGTTNEVANKVK